MPRLSGSKRKFSGKTLLSSKRKASVSGIRKLFSAARANYRRPYRYPGLGGRIGASLGNLAGMYFGQPGAGAAIGRGLGNFAHAGIKTITGRGDYTVRQNSLVFNRDAVPQFSTSNPRCTIIAHSEFIRDIRGSTSFAIDSFDINATNPNCFPWLSQIAKNYEQCVWQGLVFQFKTTCANAVSSTNTALGTVIMATNYDTLSPVFVNKQQMEASEFAQSSTPSGSIMHAIECDPSLTASQGLFYNDNPGNSNVNADPRLYNIGRFNIATQGMQAVATIGELWVTYKVCLLKPKLVGGSSWSDRWILDASTIDDGLLFGANPSLSPSSSSYQPFVTEGGRDQMMSSLYKNEWGSDYVPGPGSSMVYINPSYTGRLLVVYQLHGGSDSKSDPQVQVYGNANLLTSSLPGDAKGGFVTYSKLMAASGVGADNVLFAFVLDSRGGYGANGINPCFALLVGNPENPTYGNLAIYSIPSNL